MPVISNSKPAIGFCTERFESATGGGYTFTLTQKFGAYLREAERRYGQRNMEWTILGIEFGEDIPCVWFPYHEKLISVKLTAAAAMDPNQALFQLAHEVVHLLEPSHVTPTTVLEEGLATIFAHEMSIIDQLGIRSAEQSYIEAEAGLRELLSYHPNAVQLIRQTKKPFFNLSEEDILRACSKAPVGLAQKLSRKFTR